MTQSHLVTTGHIGSIRQSLKTVGKKISLNCTSTMTCLSNTFVGHLVIDKEKSLSRRQATVTDTLLSATVTLDKGYLFVECLLYQPSSRKPPVGPFASSFAECIRRHSAKAPYLPSASWTSSRQREQQRAPLPVPLSSALGSTHKGCFVCRVSQPHHSTKKLYQFPDVPSLLSTVVMTADKVPIC
jgi:hypothetical protein